MFTGIVQGVARVDRVTDHPGLRTWVLTLPSGMTRGVRVGASVACDGVCLTVTQLGPGPDQLTFDLMQQTLSLTTLGCAAVGDRLNVERAATVGAEIGGHCLSGHIDGQATLMARHEPANNHVLRFALPPTLMPYVFAKGYIALNGASLTVAQLDRQAAWLEVWLIPESLRMTTFADKPVGSAVNVEIERSTQMLVDTVHTQVQAYLDTLGLERKDGAVCQRP